VTALPPNPCIHVLRALDAGHEPSDSGLFGVAYSGGADSTALLLAAHALWPQQVVAIHINHGLQVSAADFEHHCRVRCAALGVPLHISRVDASAQAGQSPEDAARQARYAALAQSARSLGIRRVWLAQHLDDQLESVVLALSRGAGAAGLAGMASRFNAHGVCFERPILSLRARALRHWLDAATEAYVEDPSNADQRFTRNRIRHSVVPVLEQAFPHIAATVSRTAQHMAQAQRLLDELAEGDLSAVGDPPLLALLQAMSLDRQANFLRYWLKKQAGAAPSHAQMHALLSQVQACRTKGHRIELRVARGHVVRDASVLRYLTNL
jgi:tRNA(Ile)-lysidine synthase